MLCGKCGAKVAREAYYCKNCGEVIDDALAPGSKIEDKRFSSKFKFALQRHLVRNVVIGVFIILFATAAVKVGFNNLHAVKDNGSSKIYQLTVLGLQDPMTCRGAICHVLINVKNKTDSVQKLDSISELVTASGKQYGPADPNRMGNGSNYCRTKVAFTLQPHELVRDIGICAQDIPAGTGMVLAELRDSSGALVVSGVFKAVAY